MSSGFRTVDLNGTTTAASIAGVALLVVAAGCTDLLGTKLGRDVRIDVDPAVRSTVTYLDGRPDEVTLQPEDLPCRREPVSCHVHHAIRATIHNDGSGVVEYHRYGCYRPLRRVVHGVLQPVPYVPCVAIAIPPVPIGAGERLEVPIYLDGVEPGTYRVWFRLSDLAGEFDERRTLSNPFELAPPD